MTEEWNEIRGKFSADPGGPAPSLFLEQTEARRTENFFFETGPPPHVRIEMTGPPHYLKVWIRY